MVLPNVPLVVGDESSPVSCIILPGVLLQIGSLWRTARAVLNLDKIGELSNLLFVNIEKFYDTNTFDWQKVYNCYDINLTSKGNFAFGVKMFFIRGQDNSDEYTG